MHAELAQRGAGGGLLPLSSGSSVLGGVEIGGRARASSCSGAFAPQQLIREVARAFGGADPDATDGEDSGGELDACSSEGGGVDGDARASSGPGAVRGHFVRCSGTSPRTLIWSVLAEGATPTTLVTSGDWESQEETPRSVEVARSAFG